MAPLILRVGARFGSLWRHFTAALYLLFGRSSGVYISLNAYMGVFLSLGLVFCAKVRRRRVFLHHHTYSHIAKPSKLMRLLCRVAGTDCVHISPCERMNNELREAYPRVHHVHAISNIFAATELRAHARSPSQRYLPKLGHLSNLTLEKGLGRVVDAYRTAQSAGLASGLIVAGPCHDKACLDLIEASKAEFGSNFQYWGPVNSPQKKLFFDAIDVFLFPSLYPNETQGIVNLEALASGAGVCAFELCCIADDLSGPACLKVKPDADFTLAVSQYLKNLDVRALSCQAQSRFDQLDQEALQQVADLRKKMIGAG